MLDDLDAPGLGADFWWSNLHKWYESGDFLHSKPLALLCGDYTFSTSTRVLSLI